MENPILDGRHFAFLNCADHFVQLAWFTFPVRKGLDPGTFEIQLGASSRDIRLKAPVQITR